MILMVSVQNLEEAVQALKGGADIVDIKNLQEALVGSAHPMVAKEVRAAAPSDQHVSITLGVVPNQAGTVAMAAYAAGALGASSVKVGFMNTEYDAAVETLLACREALEGFDGTGPRGQHDLIDTRIDEFADSVNDVFGGPSNRTRTYPLDEFIHFSLIVRELRRHENCMPDLSGITSNIFTVSINNVQLVSI